MFRIPIAVILGAIFTTSVFWLLWHLVGRQVDVTQFKEAQRIDFSRLRKDTEVQTKRDQKVERERPPHGLSRLDGRQGRAQDLVERQPGGGHRRR